MTSYEHKVKNIYLWEPWWKPWPNTYAYYPLTENANDTSGNNRNLTADSSITYSTENGAFFPHSAHHGLLEPFNISTNDTWTISFWGNSLGNWYEWSDWKFVDLAETTNTWKRIAISWYNNKTTMMLNFSTGSYPSVQKTCSSNTRHHYTITIWESRATKFYMDWVVELTWTSNSYTTTNFRWGQERNEWFVRQLNWYIKDIIIETKTRTDQEVADYFDLTKTDYGIS